MDDGRHEPKDYIPGISSTPTPPTTSSIADGMGRNVLSIAA